MKYQIINGNNIDVLKTFPDNHFDSIVTDPPYGIDFLGKSWDANTGALETYQECLRVLKPGGHILAFSAARTYHHLAITLEQAGFEIRDQIMWLYSSGFPKSQDIGKSIERGEKKRKDNALGIKRSKIESGPKTNCPKCNKTLNGTNQNTCEELQCDLRDALAPADNDWAGWGTALKPAHEPIALARKPIKGSIRDNVVKYGTGALNIDATRIQGLTEKELNWTPQRQQAGDNTEIGTFGASGLIGKEISMFNDQGRFPSNVIGEIADDYQKYFYCPKVSRRERHIGHEAPEAYDRRTERGENGSAGIQGLQKLNGEKKTEGGNNHPTVKPIELMKYLIKLVTPKGGRVLDPFNGSGSTGCAAVELGCEYVGIELDPAYVEIATKRIEAWNKEDTTFKELFE
jgi:site-specific DNA-methyltransferase (adenine-specific)